MDTRSYALLALLHDPLFQQLYQQSDNEIMSWSKFRRLPMPEGYNTEEVWRVIEALRRLKSHRFPYKPYTHAEQPLETWCSLTNHIGVLLRDIVVTAHENVPHKIPKRQYRFLSILADDLCAALHRDGITVAPEIIHSLATRQRKPGCADEEVALGALVVLMDMERYAKYPLSPWMIEDVMAHFGTPVDSLSRTNADNYHPAFTFSPQEAQELIDTLLLTMNARQKEPELYLLDLLSTSMMIWDLLPFSAWNGLLELFIRHWGLESRGLAHIRLVPYGQICLAWEQGDEAIVKQAGDYFDVNPIMGEEHDATSNFGHALQLIANRLHEENAIEPIDSYANDVTTLLAQHPNLNDRQRDTLASLISDPTSQTTIQLHMNLYRVSYGTARTDLLDLAEKVFYTKITKAAPWYFELLKFETSK